MKRYYALCICLLLFTVFPVAAAAGMAGDVNMDKSVNNKDVVALFKRVSGLNVEVDETACDCTGDGSVNNKDVSLLFKYISNGNVEIYYNNTNQAGCDVGDDTGDGGNLSDD